MGVTTRRAAASAKASQQQQADDAKAIPVGQHYPFNSLLVVLLLLPPTYILLTIRKDSFGECEDAQRFIVLQILLSFAGFLFVVKMVEVGKEFCRRKGNTGKDLCKKGTPAGEIDIAESQGLATGIIYLIIIICQLLYAQSEAHLVIYDSASLSICFMLLLGFVDDVLVRIVFSTDANDQRQSHES